MQQIFVNRIQNICQKTILNRDFAWAREIIHDHKLWKIVGLIQEILPVHVTLVISTPKSILPLISKWNLSPNNFLYTVTVFQPWISQSMDNLKLWISESGFSVPNCNFHMFQYCLSQSVICRIQETQFGLHGEHWLSHALWEKFKIEFIFTVCFVQYIHYMLKPTCQS